MRFAIGVLILGVTVLSRKQFMLPERNDIAYLALLGFIGVTFHQWLQATGLQTAQATTTAWIVASTPVFIAILGWLILREKFDWVRIAGIVLIVAAGDSIRFTPPAKAISHSPKCRLWQAKWIVTRDDEQAVSTARLGP